MVSILYNNKTFIQLLYEAIGNLNETLGLRLIRIFNSFVIHHLTLLYNKNSESIGPVIRDFIVENYFNGFLLGSLTKFNKQLIDVKKVGNHFWMCEEQKGQLIKNNNYGQSIIIFEEIFHILINLLEEIAKSESVNGSKYLES